MDLKSAEDKVWAQLSQHERERVEEYSAKCTSCGACCCYYAETEGMINADGAAGNNPELSYHRRVEKHFVWPDGDEGVHVEDGMVMRTKQLSGFPACIALNGEPGKKVGCSIYEQRPLHCRLFMPGSDMCIAARKWAGFE